MKNSVCHNFNLTSPVREQCPIWAQKNDVLAFFQIGWRRLEKWRLEGWIRTTKLNGSKSGTRLYFTPDINDLLLKFSAGQKPQVKLGRTAA